MRQDQKVSDDARKLGHRGRHDIVRRHNERAVLRAIYDHGPSSRAAVANSTGLSKPTAGTVLEQLAKHGLLRIGKDVIEGRERETFAFSDGIGLAVGIEIGASHIRAGLTDITGDRSIDPVAISTPADQADLVDVVREVLDQVRARAGSRYRDIRALTIAVPGSIADSGAKIALSPTVPSLEGLRLPKRLGLSPQIHVNVENDANLAALGEGWRGAAIDSENFAAIYLAAGVGMGIVSNGKVLRGARGFAGEIAYLPIGADPHESAVRNRGAFETAVAGAGREVEASLVELMATAILSVHAILDPEVIVIGGPAEYSVDVVSGVERALASIAPFPITVRSSPLGGQAVLIGAVADARLSLLDSVLG